MNSANSAVPQINPINWLILFFYFSRVLIGCVVKLHFSKLRVQESVSRGKEAVKAENFSVVV